MKLKEKNDKVPITFGMSQMTIEKYFGTLEHYIKEIQEYGKIN